MDVVEDYSADVETRILALMSDYQTRTGQQVTALLGGGKVVGVTLMQLRLNGVLTSEPCGDDVPGDCWYWLPAERSAVAAGGSR